MNFRQLIPKPLKRLRNWLRNRFTPEARLAYAIARRTGWTVQSGPFKGMHYLSSAWGSRLTPKLIGSYEEELHEWIEELVHGSYSRIIEIGSAEGYYVVGFAMRDPNVKVIAFDSSPNARKLCERLAKANGVAGQIEVHGECSPKLLNEMSLQNALVVCDCEGYENVLLNPDDVPELKKATILVELHDCFVPGVSDSIETRFSPTHDISWVQTRDRDPGRYTQTAHLSAADRERAVDENRRVKGVLVRQNWALLRPRNISHN